MHRIFGNAVLTIVAADSAHSDAGIVGISTDRSADCISETVVEGLNIVCPKLHHMNIEWSPWNKRAWTLQERLLSKRLLICSGGYMSFHCRQGFVHENAAELGGGFLPPRLDWLRLERETRASVRCAGWPDGKNYLLSASSFFIEYANLVEQYSRREVSYGSDTLNAVEGLFSVLYSTSDRLAAPGPLLHGLPQNFIDLALLWQPAEGSSVRLRRRAGSQLPSWSWAAWTTAPADKGQDYEGGVRYERQHEIKDHRKVLESTAQQRIKPLVFWYICQTNGSEHGNIKELVPINGSGIGLPLVTEFKNDVSAKDKLFQRIHDKSFITKEDLPPSVLGRLDDRHLVFKTGWARFCLAALARPRPETL